MTVFNRIGPYEIDQEIGRGGMAVVFLARDTRTGSQVALKLVREGADRESREILDAEQRGARTVSGKWMLVHQAAAQIEAWTGRPGPLEVMARAFDAGAGGSGG